MTLHFEPETHTYRVQGAIIPAVTHVIDPLHDLSGIPAATLEYASARGKAVHLATELYDFDDLDIDSLDPEIVPYLKAWIKFREETSLSIGMIEEKLFHSVYRYAGALDRVITLFGSDAILDIKCVAKLNPATAIQTAAYKELVEKNTAYKNLKRYAVQLKRDGKYKLEEYKDPDDFRVFMSCLALHNWRAKHAS